MRRICTDHRLGYRVGQQQLEVTINAAPECPHNELMFNVLELHASKLANMAYRLEARARRAAANYDDAEELRAFNRSVELFDEAERILNELAAEAY